jgi:hypothetical protein
MGHGVPAQQSVLGNPGGVLVIRHSLRRALDLLFVVSLLLCPNTSLSFCMCPVVSLLLSRQSLQYLSYVQSVTSMPLLRPVGHFNTSHMSSHFITSVLSNHLITDISSPELALCEQKVDYLFSNRKFHYFHYDLERSGE